MTLLTGDDGPLEPAYFREALRNAAEMYELVFNLDGDDVACRAVLPLLKALLDDAQKQQVGGSEGGGGGRGRVEQRQRGGGCFVIWSMTPVNQLWLPCLFVFNVHTPRPAVCWSGWPRRCSSCPQVTTHHPWGLLEVVHVYPQVPTSMTHLEVVHVQREACRSVQCTSVGSQLCCLSALA